MCIFSVEDGLRPGGGTSGVIQEETHRRGQGEFTREEFLYYTHVKLSTSSTYIF